MSGQLMMELNGAPEELFNLAPTECEPWPDLNPRKHFDPQHMADLEASIRENGVLQNIVVHDRGELTAQQKLAGEKRYWIVAGESRWRCATVVGVRLPARIRVFTEFQALKIAMLENVQRNNLTAIEEANGFARLMELDPTLTQQGVAEIFGKKDQSYVANRLRLRKLPDSIKTLIEEGTLPPTLARDHLLRWLDEEEALQTRLFGTLIHLINSRGDTDPLGGTWLRTTAEKLDEIIAKRGGAKQPATTSTPARPSPKADPLAGVKFVSKPARDAAEKAKLTTEDFKRKKKSSSRGYTVADVNRIAEQVEAKRAAEREAQRAQKPKPPAPPKSRAEVDTDAEVEAAGEPAAAQDDDARDEVEDAGDVDGTAETVAADEVDDAAEPVVPGGGAGDAADDVEDGAAGEDVDDESDVERPEAEPVEGIVGALLPALPEHTIVMQFTPVAGAEQLLFLNITAKPMKGRAAPPPHAISGTPAEVQARLEAELRAYIETITVES